MITGNRDADTHLFRLMDDETLMNTMSTNKELLRKGEEIFKERLRDNYPYLYKKKPYLETYKNYYLKMMYYIGKLKEEFDVDYIPVASFDPEGVYRAFGLEGQDPFMKDYLIPYYIELGDEDKIRNMASKFGPRHIFNELIAHRNMKLYEKLLKEWNIIHDEIEETGPIFQNAVKSGDKEIIDFFNKMPPDDKEDDHDRGRKYFGSLGAAEIGSFEMLEYMNELFPEKLLKKKMFVDIISAAAENGHTEFVRSFLDSSNFDFLYNYMNLLIEEVGKSVKGNFLPESKLKQILGMMLDYYFANGGNEKKFFEKYKIYKNYKKNYYRGMDPKIAEFIKMKFEEHELNSMKP